MVAAPPRTGGRVVIAARSSPSRFDAASSLGSLPGPGRSWSGSPPAPAASLSSGPRLTSTRVTAASQASRWHVWGESAPTPPPSPPTALGWRWRLWRSTTTLSWGRTPPALGSWPPSRLRRASSVRASAVRWLPERVSFGVSWAGQGIQGGEQGLAGFGVELAADSDHVIQGRGDPDPAPFVAALGLTIGAVRVSDIAQVGDRPPELGWVQPPGRLEQGRLGVGGDVVGQVP